MGESFGTCSITCEHSTHGKDSSGKGRLNAEAFTTRLLNLRAYRSLRSRMSTATLPGGSAEMIRLDPQPTSSTGPWPEMSSVMCL